ncbi:hypothetical protein C8J57DRAFT_1713714 [Mycena rebaudengoi]|nr:hypothetical protein C8J57DRAFT_1713714 [Mycena rebaudengoi]
MRGRRAQTRPPRERHRERMRIHNDGGASTSHCSSLRAREVCKRTRSRTRPPYPTAVPDPPCPPASAGLTSPNPYPHSGGGSHSPSSAASVYSDSLAPSAAPITNNHAANPTTAATGSTSLNVLIERTQALLQRMQSADALSLTNRLKRQQIHGVNVRHLSQSTVAGILVDVGPQLRATGAYVAPTAYLDATITTTTTAMATKEVRKRDARALVGVLRDVWRVSEAAMDPGKVAAASKGVEGSGGGGWMAPLSQTSAHLVTDNNFSTRACSRVLRNVRAGSAWPGAYGCFRRSHRWWCGRRGHSESDGDHTADFVGRAAQGGTADRKR